MKMKLWKKAVALLLGSTLLFGMTACGDSSPTSSTADSGDTVKVGLLHSLSGTMAISETSVRDAELLMDGGRLLLHPNRLRLLKKMVLLNHQSLLKRLRNFCKMTRLQQFLVAGHQHQERLLSQLLRV